MKLEDGRGTGKLVEVDANHRMLTSAIASDAAEAANRDTEAFLLSSGIFSIGAAAEHKIAYIKNGEASRDLIIDLEIFFNDGGTTSNSNPVFFNCFLNSDRLFAKTYRLPFRGY